ncbi:MAG: MBOAT family O-acyltransferase [Eubacteriales bacterium]
MVFSSLVFLYGFLPLCFVLYFIRPSIRYRNWVLVVLSLLFYAWGEPIYVVLLMVSALLNYLLGRAIGNRKEDGEDTNALLWLAVFINLGFLGFFKYTGFLVENINVIAGLNLAIPEITLPIGISFYTFQALSYVIDVHRGKVGVQRSYRDFLLYVALFPQLIAGPIVRYSEIEPQLQGRTSTPKDIFTGLTRFLVGLGKKVLIANYAGSVSAQILDGNLANVSTLGIWFGLIMFSFMIYFDFSGYSDMAIGLGRMFGFRYSENFNYPYIANSITEFWRRWHISLSSFFRDYVYIPLGGNRKHQLLNLLVVWGLTGMWHGASWNFILWGLYFFILLYVEKKSMKVLKKMPKILRHMVTLFWVVIGWALFYCTDFSRLAQTFGVMFGTYGAGFTDSAMWVTIFNNLPLLILCIIGCTPLPLLCGVVIANLFGTYRKNATPKWAYIALTFLFQLGILAICTISLVGSSYNPFLYFRF